MTARLRLLLALLVLALAPVLAPAADWGAMAPGLTATDPHGCDQPCDAMDQPGHVQAACPCGIQSALAPLTSVPLALPVSLGLVVRHPTDATLSSARWPPPLRPPRA